MKHDLIIFDLDGTLIDSRADLAASANAMRGEYGLPPLPQSTVSSYVGNGMRRLVERTLAGSDVDVDEAIERFRGHYDRRLHDQTVLYPGVREGLEALVGHGCLLAVSSNKPGDWCRRIVEHFGLTPRFRCVIGGGDTARLKPDPEQLLAVQARCDRGADRTLMVGDNSTDLAAARRAGVPGVFVRWGIGRAEPEVPDHEVETFAELVAWILADG